MDSPQDKPIEITEQAYKKLKDLINEHQSWGIKVSLKSGGCAGFTYELDLVEHMDRVDSLDIIIAEKDINLVLDKHSLVFLFGTRLDFKQDNFSSTFVFENSNQTSACGCGKSIGF